MCLNIMKSSSSFSAAPFRFFTVDHLPPSHPPSLCRPCFTASTNLLCDPALFILPGSSIYSTLCQCPLAHLCTCPNHLSLASKSLDLSCPSDILVAPNENLRTRSSASCLFVSAIVSKTHITSDLTTTM